MNHLMIDLETLGTSADSVVLSVGAVKFDLDSKNVKNGKTVACYMEGEIAGFAFHLVQA